MNTGIKTCTKCGAKNFLEFKTCFNCGGTEFVVNKNVVPPTTEEVNKRAPVGLQHVSLQQRAERPAAPKAAPAERPAAAERRIAEPSARAERPAAARPVSGERLERVQRAAKTPDPERRTIFDPGREIKRPLTGAEKEERVKNAVKRTAPPPPESTPSKLNMQAQQERLKLKAPHSAEQQAAPQDAVLDKIAEKLEHLEKRLDAAPAEDAAFSETQALRRAVSEDMAKLDEAIAELKSGNREVLDMVVNAQREQIERLEQERAETEQKLREAGEERSKSLGALGYLDEEKRNLEVQLAAERERFDLLLKDRETFKQLAVMNQPELPSEYVVFTGEQTDPDYLDYARRQFLKIYPKIEADGDKEDVIYYIPGEFKNPPVLVLNPNVSRPNKRDIKINFIDPTLGVEERGSRALIEEAEPPAEEQAAPQSEAVFPADEAEPPQAEARPAVPPVIPVETRAPESESVGEAAARESVSELLARMRAEEEKERAEAERAEAQEKPAPETPQPDEAPKKAFTFEEVLSAEDVLSPRIPDIAEAEKPKAPDAPSRPAPERAARGKRVKKADSKRPMAACLILGALFAVSLLPLLLGYLGDASLSIKGYDVLAANIGLFKESALAENAFGLLIVSAGFSDAPLAAMAKFMPLILLMGSVFTLAAAVLCFVKPKALGLLRALRIMAAAVALALDLFFTAGLTLVIGIPTSEVFTLLLPGLWVRLAADLLLLVAGIVFMRIPRVRQADELNIKPLNITDKRAPEPEIELSQSLMRERDEIVGK